MVGNFIGNLRNKKTAQGNPRNSNLITSGLKGIGNLTGIRKKSGASEKANMIATDASVSVSLENLKTPTKAKFVSFVANRLLDKDTALSINKDLNIHNTVYQKQAREANNPRLQFREKLGEFIGKSISGDLSQDDTKKAQHILLNQNKGILRQFVTDANKIFADPTLMKSDSHKLTMDTLEMAGLVKREVNDNIPTYSLVKNPTGEVKSAEALYKDQASSDMPTSNRLQYGNKEEAEKLATAEAVKLFNGLPNFIEIERQEPKKEFMSSDIIIPNRNGGMAEIRTKIDNDHFGDTEIIITDENGTVSNITNKKELKTDFKQGDVIITDENGTVSSITNKEKQKTLEKTPAGSKHRAEQREKTVKTAEHDAVTVVASNVSQQKRL